MSGMPYKRFDATCRGVAALAAVGAGVIGRVEDIDTLLPHGERIAPGGDAPSRHQWRDFVARAAGLMDEAPTASPKRHAPRT